jgi:predicted  nucleic acid-binding Zn-ribbon protein
MVYFDSKPSEKLSIEDQITKLKEIQSGLRQNLSHLRCEIERLESKPELQSSIENLRKDSEIRAIALETEVKRLREDLRSIRAVLGLNLEGNNSSKS